MTTRETPWLEPRTTIFGNRVYGKIENEIVNPWLCAATVQRFFNIPRARRIKVVVSNEPVRGAIRLHGAPWTSLIIKLREGHERFRIYCSFSAWLGQSEYWGWIEYEA